jgi:hypothetical protein
MKKITFSLKNFSNQNTPGFVHSIGDWGLKISAVGLMVIGLPIALEAEGVTGVVLPIVVLKGAKVCVAFGVMSKTIAKLFGTIEIPTSDEQVK